MIFKLNVIYSNRIESFFKDQEINFRFGSVGRTIFLIAVYSDLATLTKLYMQPGIYLYLFFLKQNPGSDPLVPSLYVELREYLSGRSCHFDLILNSHY